MNVGAAIGRPPTQPPVISMNETQYPKRKQNRLQNYDYSMPHGYFITVCTQDRKNLFWMDERIPVTCKKEVMLTKYGKMVDEVILSIPAHYPSVSVDDYVIMPNHIHLLLQIHTDPDGRPMAINCGVIATGNDWILVRCAEHHPTIQTVVNQMKGAASKWVGFSLWQKGFYDHIVRNDRDYQEIIRYIQGNPAKWLEDKLYRMR